MIDFIMLDINILFVAALSAVFLFFIIEVILLFTSGLSITLGLDFPDVHFDSEIMGVAADWLHFGKVPAFAILISFLCTFGVTGLGVQLIYFSIIGNYASVLISFVITFAISIVILNQILSVLINVFSFRSDEDENMYAPELILFTDAVILSPVLNESIMAEAEVILSDNSKYKIYVKTKNLSLVKGDRGLLKEYVDGVYYM